MRINFRFVCRRLTFTWVLAVSFLGLAGCATIDLAPTQAPSLRIEEAHLGGATRVEFNVDGSRIATGGARGDIHIWALPEGTRLGSLKAHEGKVRGLLWIDDNTVVSGAEDGRLLIWDLGKGTNIRSVVSTSITAVGRIPGRVRIVTGHSDGHIRLWSYPGLDQLAAYRMEGRVLSVATRSDGEQVAASNNRGEVILLPADLSAGSHLPTNGKDAHEIRYSPDGRQLAAGTWFDLHFWDLASHSLAARRTEHMGAVISVDYTPRGKHLISLGRHTDAKIRLLNLGSGEVERRLASHDLCGYSIRVGPNGRFVATASEDESVRLYDIGAPYRPTWSVQAGEKIYAKR